MCGCGDWFLEGCGLMWGLQLYSNFRMGVHLIGQYESIVRLHARDKLQKSVSVHSRDLPGDGRTVFWIFHCFRARAGLRSLSPKPWWQM